VSLPNGGRLAGRRPNRGACLLPNGGRPALTLTGGARPTAAVTVAVGSAGSRASRAEGKCQREEKWRRQRDRREGGDMPSTESVLKKKVSLHGHRR
jgi:hypothetical protein